MSFTIENYYIIQKKKDPLESINMLLRLSDEDLDKYHAIQQTERERKNTLNKLRKERKNDKKNV